MPIVTDTERDDLLASCRDALCPGAAQVRVRGIESHAAFTYGELGGGVQKMTDPRESMIAQLPEREAVHYRWLDPADEPCPECGRARLLSPDTRPVYETKSGQDPLLIRKQELGIDQEKSDRAQALELQRQQLAEAKRTNDLREREVALREREAEEKAARAAKARAAKAKAPVNGNGEAPA